ncbi:FecR family protein [Bordetella sp. 2513F-2]
MEKDFDPALASPLSDQVVNWLLLLRSGRATPHDYADFIAWRGADPRHENAWQQLTGSLGSPSAGRLSDAYPLAPVPRIEGSAAAARRAASAPARRRFMGGVAALATGVLAGGGYLATTALPLGAPSADAATQTGERRRYTLADGSRLLLNARSRVNFEFTSTYRLIHLLAGAVSVEVAGDAARPFLVRTAEGVVRSNNDARYMVRQQMHRTLVVVHSGEVGIETHTGARASAAGSTGLRFDSARVGPARSDLIADAAWEHGWIEAHGRPLAEVVASLRPYHPGTLRVSMAAGGLPVYGRYPLDDPAEVLDTLERAMPIQVHRFTPWFVSIGVAQA